MSHHWRDLSSSKEVESPTNILRSTSVSYLVIQQHLRVLRATSLNLQIFGTLFPTWSGNRSTYSLGVNLRSPSRSLAWWTKTPTLNLGLRTQFPTQLLVKRNPCLLRENQNDTNRTSGSKPNPKVFSKRLKNPLKSVSWISQLSLTLRPKKGKHTGLEDQVYKKFNYNSHPWGWRKQNSHW